MLRNDGGNSPVFCRDPSAAGGGSVAQINGEKVAPSPMRTLKRVGGTREWEPRKGAGSGMCGEADTLEGILIGGSVGGKRALRIAGSR